ncbi:PAS domain-containing protein [Natronomonas halophila]|uniref:PAS domain S-box protein n=1 Tax=Natronomonas halophila TaxID=2747817 RepID=UPI0015B688EC|nr:PAS domain S-box protein [Natronomonas halophila]QLD85460.1 PAS domain-containing protein [Natronomonas halophila]
MDSHGRGARDSASVDGSANAGRGADSTARVLHLDDEPTFLETSKRLLEHHEDFVVKLETDPEAALDRLDSVDCIVSDYDMPTMNGIEFLEAVRAQDPDLPFILFTGKGSEEIASEAIRAGVTDYLQKGADSDRFAILANRITNAVERHRAEKRATAADHRARRVYERIDDAFIAVDDEWRFTYVNQRAGELLDSDPEALVGTKVRDAFPEVVGSRFDEEYRRAVEQQETVTFEEYYEPLDAWFEVRAYPDDSGLSVYFRDVTEKKERERRYDAVFNNTYQFTGLLEPDGTLIEANEAALSFVDADREEVVDRSLWETPWFQLNDETRRIARQSVQQAREGSFYRDELPVEGADGQTIIVDYSVRPVTDESGEVTLLVPEGRDITDRKEREAELREERAITESIFSALPDVLYVFDESGRFIRWNDQLSSVTGYSDEEITEMRPWDFVPESEREKIQEAIDGVFDADRTMTVESAFVTKDGERIPYEFTGAQLTDDDGQTLGLVGIGRDISERKEREQQLERKNEQLEEFASLISHDLKTPLSVASGNLRLARETGEDRYLDEIETALDRMGTLVDEVLELAKQGEVVDDVAPVRLRPMLSDIETATGADVETAYPDGAAVMAEKSRLYSLLSNLVANSDDHGGEDVTVEVGLDGETLYVADDGRGIPEEERDTVFDPGYSGDDGSGFGLAIAEAIADAHGWEIDVTDSEAGGARFEISGVNAQSVE